MSSPFTCPACKRPLMSRHHKTCHYCGAELPSHLLATPSEKDAEFKAWKRADADRQKRNAQADAEERARRADID